MSIRSSSDAARGMITTPGGELWATPRSQVVAYDRGIALVPRLPFGAKGLKAAMARIPSPAAGRPDRIIEDAIVPRIAYEGSGYVSLHDVIAVSEFTTMETAVIGGEIAELLAALEREGLCHGALCPRTVALDSYQRVRLLETGFGLRGRPDASGHPFCSDDVLAGAPPKIEDDVFSLGAILFVCCAGKPPFGAAREVDGRAPRLDVAIPFSDLPDTLVDLVDAMLDPDPAERPCLDAVQHTLDQIQRSERRTKSGRPLESRDSGVQYRPLPRSPVPPAPPPKASEAPARERERKSRKPAPPSSAGRGVGPLAIGLIVALAVAVGALIGFLS